MGTHRNISPNKADIINFGTEVKKKLYGENFKEASDQEIIEEVQSWKGLQVTVFWENLRELKRESIKQSSQLDFSYFIFPNFEKIPPTMESAFNFWEAYETLSFVNEVSFHKCKFVGKTNFKNIFFKEKVNFSNVIFYQGVNFKESHFLKNSNFTKIEFKEDALFYQTHFEKQILFDESVFYGRTVFHKATFLKEACFSLVSSKYRITFFSCDAKKISFKYSRLNHVYFVQNNFNYLNLHGIAIQNPFFSDNQIKEAERETFAYMKHFF